MQDTVAFAASKPHQCGRAGISLLESLAAPGSMVIADELHALAARLAASSDLDRTAGEQLTATT